MKMDNDDTFAEEIVEIFAEEVVEVLAQIDKHLLRWQADSNDMAALKEVRRAFHTLKGSGRMVQAEEIAELAWAVENTLNRVLDGSLSFHPLMVQLVEHVQQVIPALLKAFRKKQAAALAGVNIALLIDQANALREGGVLTNLEDFVLPPELAATSTAAELVADNTLAVVEAISDEISSDSLHHTETLYRDFAELKLQLDTLEKKLQVLDKQANYDELNRHLEHSDRQVKELKYFVSNSSKEVFARVQQAQQRLTGQLEKELQRQRVRIAEIEIAQQEQNALYATMAQQIKLWSIGSAIVFSVLAVLVARYL